LIDLPEVVAALEGLLNDCRMIAGSRFRLATPYGNILSMAINIYKDFPFPTNNGREFGWTLFLPD
jgi:hypothetical protein